ncbi:regulatory protein-modification [Caudoviricetes sp.]|nr:regulatory protein-modification [Caudoviricetes sp.]
MARINIYAGFSHYPFTRYGSDYKIDKAKITQCIMSLKKLKAPLSFIEAYLGLHKYAIRNCSFISQPKEDLVFATARADTAINDWKRIYVVEPNVDIYKPWDIKLFQELKEYIDNKKEDLSEISRKVGIPYATLSDVIKNRRKMSTMTACRIRKNVWGDPFLNIPEGTIIVGSNLNYLTLGNKKEGLVILEVQDPNLTPVRN